MLNLKAVLAASVLVLGSTLVSAYETATNATEKCYGVAVAGQGQKDPITGKEYLELPAGVCAKINGGTTSDATSAVK